MNLLSWIDRIFMGRFVGIKHSKIHEEMTSTQEKKTEQQAEELRKLKAELQSYKYRSWK